MIAVDVVSLLGVLLWVVAGIAAVVLLALCLPLRVAGSVSGLDMSELAGTNLEETAWRLSVRGLLGLVALEGSKEPQEAPRVQVRLAGISRPIQGGGSPRRRKERQRPPAQAARKRQGRRTLSWRDVRSLLPELRVLLARLWRSLGLQARGDLVYGFDDPYVTGWCEALRAVVPVPRELKIMPDFLGARLAGWAELRMTIYPIRVAGVLVATFFRRGVLRVWWPRLKARLARPRRGRGRQRPGSVRQEHGTTI